MKPAIPMTAFLSGLLLAACSGPVQETPTRVSPVDAIDALDWRVTTHRGDDDLLTAGLGLEGLRALQPPALADAGVPDAADLRRRAVWANWRGIADFTQPDAVGQGLPLGGPVPGREFHAFARLDGARHPHRVMVQVPDDFDAGQRCLVVTAASGSRGVYGAIALASGWGLPRGCAVVHTDKGAGTGWQSLPDGWGARLDGTPGQAGEGLEFDVAAVGGGTGVAVKHAHSGDNPEADWGRHVRQAAMAGLAALGEAFPAQAPFTPQNTRILAVGVSNGGGAVLRAAEQGEGWLDGVVAVSPNILPAQGGRALYDVATEAALLMPCALLAPAFDGEPMARPGGVRPPAWEQRCNSLAEAGWVSGDSTAARAEAALEQLLAGGWTHEALVAGTLSVGFDLWRAVAVTYASAYTRSGPLQMPCGYRFAVLDADGTPRVPRPAERARWWSDGAGVPPGSGVMLVDSLASGATAVPTDPSLAGLMCLRALWTEASALGGQLRDGVEATTAALPPRDLPIVVIHGLDDGLVPEAHTAGPYVAWLRAAGADVTYWGLTDVQHFDAFLGLPGLGQRYRPLLPRAWQALDALSARLDAGTPVPETPTLP